MKIHHRTVRSTIFVASRKWSLAASHFRHIVKLAVKLEDKQ